MRNLFSIYNIAVLWNECSRKWPQIVTFIACISDPAELPKSWFSVALFTENSRSCRLDLGRFLAYLMNLMALKAATNVNQVALNINLCVKAITDVKKSAKATANFQWCHSPKINFSVALPGQIYRLLIFNRENYQNFKS